MKQTLKTLIRNVKSINGNSLAEFATTTALMATLAATAAPKLSEMSEGTKAEKSRNEIDKLIKQAGTYYQDTADDEGRGRFPGQSKFNVSVGGVAGAGYDNHDASTSGTIAAQAASNAHHVAILTDLGAIGTGDEGWEDYDEDHAAGWVSVFGTANEDAPLPFAASTEGVSDNVAGTNDWKNLMGDETLRSRFQDGHYVYSVVAGGGSGSNVYPPVLYVGDIENMTDFNNVLEP
jgi:hypothetical protein